MKRLSLRKSLSVCAMAFIVSTAVLAIGCSVGDPGETVPAENGSAINTTEELTNSATVTEKETETSELLLVTDSDTENELFLEYDVVFLNQELDMVGYLYPSEDCNPLGSEAHVRYEPADDPEQLFAFQAIVYCRGGSYLGKDPKSIWKELCRDNGFIPWFPEEAVLPGADAVLDPSNLFYMLATLEQVKNMRWNAGGNYYHLIIADLPALPEDRTGGPEPFAHVTVKIPEEAWN